MSNYPRRIHFKFRKIMDIWVNEKRLLNPLSDKVFVLFCISLKYWKAIEK